MNNNRYNVNKNYNRHDSVRINNDLVSGFDITPKNNINYDGVEVKKLVIVKQAFIEKILKKKIKRKLELYLKFIIDFIDGDSSDGDTLREVLNDLTRYKDIINYRYRKYLGEKYIDLLLKKIELLEYELKVKLYTIEENQYSMEEENIGPKSR